MQYIMASEILVNFNQVVNENNEVFIENHKPTFCISTPSDCS